MNMIPLVPASLLDQYQRRFTYLRLSITEACNFRCNYCLPNGYCPSENYQPLSVPEIQTLIAAFAESGTRKIRITGGEPSLRKDLVEIIGHCKEQQGINTVALTSNGYRIHQQLPALYDAGLDALNLSADSLDPSVFKLITGHDKLGSVLKAVDTALALGIKKVKLNAVLLKQHNSQELKHYLEFVRQRPVSLRMIELMETGDNPEFFKAQHLSGQSIEAQLLQGGWQLCDKPIDSGPAQEYWHPDYAGKIGLIMPYSKNFCADCNRLRVSSTGKLHLCLFHEADADLRPHLKNGDTLGLQEHLREIVTTKWQGHQLLEGNTADTRHLAMLGG